MNIEEQEKLVLENIELVKRIALQFSTIPEVLEELISVGNIALIEASKTFSEEKGSKFSSYVGVSIVNRMKKYIKNLPKNMVSLESVVNLDGIPLVDLIEDQKAVNPEREIIKKETNTQLYEVINELEPRTAWIMSRYYGLNGEEAITLEAIGDYLGLTRARIHQIVQETLEILKKRLNKKGDLD